MSDFISDGRAIDLIVGLVVVEAFAVLGWRAITGRGPAPLAFVCNLIAGAFLLVALRNALTQSSPSSIGACLAAALVAHLADLRGRWPGGTSAALGAPPPSAAERDDFPAHTEGSCPRRAAAGRDRATTILNGGPPHATTGKVTAIAKASASAVPSAAARGSPVRA
jgi:hypothetical protein